MIMTQLVDIREGKTTTIPGGFIVNGKLGGGGFSEVYKAYDPFHKTHVAVKIYRNSDEYAFDIAEREMEIIMNLSKLGLDYFPQPIGGLRKYPKEGSFHPQIVLELGEYIGEDGQKLIISLKDIIPNEDSQRSISQEIPQFWELEPTLNMMRYICDAVKTLHKQGIIHRDLKPSNILLKRPPGSIQVKPFILDFNTSVRSGAVMLDGGTDKYLPPEVLAGKRINPDIADDLWATSLTLSEFIFGAGRRPKEGSAPHAYIKFELRSGLREILSKALSPKPEDRYPNADEFYAALGNELNMYFTLPKDEKVEKPKPKDQESLISDDDLEWARENRSRLGEDIRCVIAGEHELPLSKHIRDRVSFLYSSLLNEESHSFNIKNDLKQLGVRAIPDIIEESHKIPIENRAFGDVVEALSELASEDMELAKRAIKNYCVSGDFVVRRICLQLCQSIEFFPNNLIYNILENDSLYLPQERVNIADLCIRFSDDDSVLLALTTYMAREYILDYTTNRYKNLKRTIAARLGELKFENKARAIVDDTKMRIWEDLREYEMLNKSLKEVVDRGLLELLADAFASLGAEALDIIEKHKLPNKCENNKLPIASVFIGKLAQNYLPARQWLFKKLQNTHDKVFYFAARRLKESMSSIEKKTFKGAGERIGISEEGIDSIPDIFQSYLNHEHPNDMYKLREKGGYEALGLVEDELRVNNDTETIIKLVKLLTFFMNKYRQKTLRILVENWPAIAEADYNRALIAFTGYEIPSEALKKQVLDILDADLKLPERKEKALDAIDKVLKR